MVDDLFSSSNPRSSAHVPLAEVLRPRILSDIIGQEHLLAAGMPIALMVAHHHLSSFILWGPAGSGKTTLARCLAHVGNAYFIPVSAIFTNTTDLRRILTDARSRHSNGQQVILFIDEIHRFNRAIQDIFLPALEDGTLVVIGATTENPSFALTPALLSRCSVFEIHSLTALHLDRIRDRGLDYLGLSNALTMDAKATLVSLSGGDARYLLSLIERIALLCALPTTTLPLTDSDIRRMSSHRSAPYDKAQDHHYNLLSALHKSVRGSDAQASLYWFSRMMVGGEDAAVIARRLTRMAAEDIGLADPTAVGHVLHAWQAYERLGSPEGELCLAEAVLYLALAPKSNAVYLAEKSARTLANATAHYPPPKSILNAPTRTMKDLGYGEGYRYDHDFADAYAGQDFFPDGVGIHQQDFYTPTERGFEKQLKQRLAYFATLKTLRRSSAKKNPD